jgi:RNA polymerase sigma factor (sigma-70 family)
VTAGLDDLERSQPSVDEPPAETLSHNERLEAAMDELQRLDPHEQEVVRLRHLEGHSFEQIARQQGLPPSTVKDRCYRALVKLKGRLKRRDVSA